jgi:heat shock protein HslJ
VPNPFLLHEEVGVLRLRPALTAVLWQWQGIAAINGEVTLRPDQPEKHTVAFLEDSKLAIQADCNRATGNYSVTRTSADV